MELIYYLVWPSAGLKCRQVVQRGWLQETGKSGTQEAESNMDIVFQVASQPYCCFS